MSNQVKIAWLHVGGSYDNALLNPTQEDIEIAVFSEIIHQTNFSKKEIPQIISDIEAFNFQPGEVRKEEYRGLEISLGIKQEDL